jgi:hypothetical protein
MPARPRKLPSVAAACLCGLWTAAPAAAGPKVTVDAAAGVHAISDDIYGMNFASEDLAANSACPCAAGAATARRATTGRST